MTQHDAKPVDGQAPTEDAHKDASKDSSLASDPLSITRAARAEPVVETSGDHDGDADEAADGSDIETAEEIGFASEAGNR